VTGSGISWVICKSAPHCRQLTLPALQDSVLQAGCRSCHRTNSIKALKAQLTIKIHTQLFKQFCRQTKDSGEHYIIIITASFQPVVELNISFSTNCIDVVINYIVITDWRSITLDAVYRKAWRITDAQPLIADVDVLDKAWTRHFLHTTIAQLRSVQFVHEYCSLASNTQTCRRSLSRESRANKSAAAILLELNALDLVILQHCHRQQPDKPLFACSHCQLHTII